MESDCLLRTVCVCESGRAGILSQLAGRTAWPRAEGGLPLWEGAFLFLCVPWPSPGESGTLLPSLLLGLSHSWLSVSFLGLSLMLDCPLVGRGSSTGESHPAKHPQRGSPASLGTHMMEVTPEPTAQCITWCQVNS